MNTVADVHDLAQRLRASLDRVVVGQPLVKERLLACLLAGGHALLEGVPGTAKTLLALALARLLGCTFRRIQFTPDLMPIDLLGTNIFSQKTQDFTFLPGPVFTDVLLADEINRTPPRTQSALLEAMQERAVTIDGHRHPLSPAFFVCATQNPIEFEGTYPLPEAQRDRFLLKISINHPERDDELAVLRAYASGNSLHDHALAALTPLTDPAGIVRAREVVVTQVRAEEKLIAYIRDVVAATRKDDSLQLGAGPRASLALLATCRALAALRGRDFITPDDVKELAPAVLVHRVTLAPEAEMEGTSLTDVLERIFTRIEVPR
jgi:MoxR-like ATPase